MDQVTLDRIKLLHPSLIKEGEEIYKAICTALKGKAICRFAYTLRTNVEQDGLYAKGRTISGKIVTNAKGGYSYHNYGLAVDIVLLKDKDGNGSFETASWETNVDFDGDGVFDWIEVVNIFKSYGWEWGGDWKFTDNPHFQKTLGKNIQQLLKLPKDSRGYVIL
jgi:peptidoglycan L-alanyl-D-glutamate endopeptidase CwlK